MHTKTHMVAGAKVAVMVRVVPLEEWAVVETQVVGRSQTMASRAADCLALLDVRPRLVRHICCHAQ